MTQSDISDLDLPLVAALALPLNAATVSMFMSSNKFRRLAVGILPEALRTRCLHCSNHQKEGALKVITKLYYDYPEQYARLRGRWDVTGEYHRQFEEYLRELQFNAITSEHGECRKRDAFDTQFS